LSRQKVKLLSSKKPLDYSTTNYLTRPGLTDGEKDFKGAPLANLAFYLYGAVVVGDNSVDHGQALTNPLFLLLGGKERLEDALLVFLGNAAARIRNRDFQETVLVCR